MPISDMVTCLLAAWISRLVQGQCSVMAPRQSPPEPFTLSRDPDVMRAEIGNHRCLIGLALMTLFSYIVMSL